MTTILQRVEQVLTETPWLTATEVAHKLGLSNASTVSSIMYRAMLVGHLKRRPATRKHRGWEYALDEDE